MIRYTGHRTPLALAGLLVLCAAGGCDRRAREIRDSDRAALAFLERVPLASSARTDLDAPPAALRVWIDRTGIGLDESAYWAGLTSAQLDRLDEAGFAPEGDRISPILTLATRRLPPEAIESAGAYMVKPVFERLDSARERLTRSDALLGGEFSGRVVLWIDGETPFATLARVLYSLGQAQLSVFLFAVETPAGIRVLEVDAPTLRARPCEPHTCRGLTASVTKGGLVWREREQAGGGCKREAGIEMAGAGGKDAPAGLADALDGVKGLDLDGHPNAPAPVGPAPAPPPEPGCHALARIDGRLDLSALRAGLAARGPGPPACKTVVLSASEDIPWQELVAVTDELARAGHPRFVLAVGIVDDRCGT